MSAAHLHEPIYLDHPATTPCDPRVVAAMLEWMTGSAANAGQRHAPGRAARAATDLARSQVATALGLDPEAASVVLTSGATEANNLAVLGAAASMRPGSRIITCAVEHASVLAPARHLAARGVDVRIVGVDEDGIVDLDELSDACRDAELLSVQAVNNETGVVQPIEAIGRIAREAGARLHVDAVQAFGKVDIDLRAWGVDLVSISAHKVNGPTGIGALVATSPEALDTLAPIVHGGGQERGLRAGTTNVAGAVGFGEAARIVRTCGRAERARYDALRARLERGLLDAVPGLQVNGSGARRGPAIASCALPKVEGGMLLARLPRIVAGTTSACSSGGSSHVLRAMGCDEERMAGTVRFGVGRTTTPAQVDLAVDLVAEAYHREAAGGSRSGRPVAFA